MRDIDSTENRQVQVETEDHTEESSLVVGKSPSTMRKRIFIILSLLSLYFLWGGTYLAMRIALKDFRHSYWPVCANLQQACYFLCFYGFASMNYLHESNG